MDILKQMLLDPDMMPRVLPFHLMQDITNNFSSDNRIGIGGSGEVYKGILQSGELIAVKKFYPTDGSNDAFMDEFRNIMKVKVKHQNIVRFIGYSFESIKECEMTEGQPHMVVSRKRLLCFEYLHKGSLDSYLCDESHRLDWDTSYKIIRGVCDGLKYLHGIPMYHLDLKPANILLDKNMLPKIADFGLSRLSGRDIQTMHTKNIGGTIGYMPPECASSGTITDKVDIYSLGIIIMQIMVGYRDYPKRHEMLPQEFKKLGMTKLFNMPQVTTFQNTALFEAYYEQGCKCFEIALKCTDPNRMNRPTIHDVLCTLDETENIIKRVLELVRPNSIDLVGIDPMQLRFPFKENVCIYCPLHITNKTDGFVGYFVVVKNPVRYQIKNNGSRGVLDPRSTGIVLVEMREQQQQLSRIGLEVDEFDIMVISMENQRDLTDVMFEITASNKEIKDHDLFQRVCRNKGMVHGWVTLMAIICAPEASKYEVREDENNINYDETRFWNRRFICAHPTEKWMLGIDDSGDVIVWKHETEHNLPITFTDEFKLDVTMPHLLYSFFSMIGLPYGKVTVTSAKFFAQRPWIVCGDEKGNIHVCNFITREKVKQFSAHQAKITALAVHPTQLLVLSACEAQIIKLWNCEKEDWMCTRQFAAISGDCCNHLTFNPNDNVSFASGFGSAVKVWNINFDSPRCTLPVSKFDSASPFVCGDQPYLVTNVNNKIHIWDWHTGRCVKQLTLWNDINSVACHPRLPIIVAGFPERIIAVLNTTTFRLEYIDSLLVHPIPGLGSVSLSILTELSRLANVDCEKVYGIREVGFHDSSGGLASLTVRHKYGISLHHFKVPVIMDQHVDSM